MGRHKTPTNILKLRDSKHAKGRDKEPEPPKGRPPRPPGNSDDAEQIRQQVCDVLEDMGLLSLADGALERYAQMYSVWRRIQGVVDMFDTPGKLVAAWSNEERRAIIRNAMSESRQLDGQLRAFEAAYGMTPAARARLACLLNGDVNKHDRDEREVKFFGVTG